MTMPTLYSDRQIGLIRESGRIVAGCLELAKRLLRPGYTTKELNEAIGDYIAKEGGKSAFLGYSMAGKVPFPAYACLSTNNIVVHGLPTDEPLREGDLLSVDIGVSKGGYIADSAWTFPVGACDEEGVKLMRVGEESLAAGLAAIKPKGLLVDVSRAIQRTVEWNGFSVVREFVGHGVGHNLHEEPQVRNYIEAGDLRPGGSVVLKPGMVLAIEPMVNEGAAGVLFDSKRWPVSTADGKRSVHFEHTVAITSTGATILTAPNG